MTRYAPPSLLGLLLLSGLVLGLVRMASGGAGTDDGLQATVEGRLCSAAALFNPLQDADKEAGMDRRDDEALRTGYPAGSSRATNSPCSWSMGDCSPACDVPGRRVRSGFERPACAMTRAVA